MDDAFGVTTVVLLVVFSAFMAGIGVGSDDTTNWKAISSGEIFATDKATFKCQKINDLTIK